MVNLFDTLDFTTLNEYKDFKVEKLTYKPKKKKTFEEMNLVQQIYLLSDIPFEVISSFESRSPVWGYEKDEMWSYYSRYRLVRSAIVNGIEDSDWGRFISYYVKAFGCTADEAEGSPLVNYLRGGTVDTNKIQKDYEGMT